MRPGKTAGFLVCTFILLGSNSYAQISVGDALSKFASAGIAYKEGRYDEAISRYNEISGAGRESGPIYYNLGNSYFKKGDIGNTALSYARAKKFIPRDSDLLFNEKYTQSKIDQYGSGKNPNIFEFVLDDFIQFWTVDEVVIILVGLMISIGVESPAERKGSGKIEERLGRQTLLQFQRIAHSPDVDEVARVGRVRFEFGAQAVDVRFDQLAGLSR